MAGETSIRFASDWLLFLRRTIVPPDPVQVSTRTKWNTSSGGQPLATMLRGQTLFTESFCTRDPTGAGSPVTPHQTLKSFSNTYFLLILVVMAGCGQATDTTTLERSTVPRAVESFHLLRTPSNDMPLVVRTHLSNILVGQLNEQINPTLVHRTNTGKGAVWVFRTDHALCLAQDGRGAVGCSTFSRARSHGISLGIFSPPTSTVPRPHNFLLIGLVPDGIKRVEVTVGNRRRTVEVHNNLFAASGDQPVNVGDWSRQSEPKH